MLESPSAQEIAVDAIKVFRVRVGRFRVLYSVSDARLVIFILKIGHRKDIYR